MKKKLKPSKDSKTDPWTSLRKNLYVGSHNKLSEQTKKNWDDTFPEKKYPGENCVHFDNKYRPRPFCYLNKITISDGIDEIAMDSERKVNIKITTKICPCENYKQK